MDRELESCLRTFVTVRSVKTAFPSLANTVVLYYSVFKLIKMLQKNYIKCEHNYWDTTECKQLQTIREEEQPEIIHL